MKIDGLLPNLHYLCSIKIDFFIELTFYSLISIFAKKEP